MSENTYISNKYVFTDIYNDINLAPTKKLTIDPTSDTFKLEYDLTTVPKTFIIDSDGMNWTDGTTTLTTPLEKIGALADAFPSVEIAPDTTTLSINDKIIVSDSTNIINIDGGSDPNINIGNGVDTCVINNDGITINIPSEITTCEFTKTGLIQESLFGSVSSLDANNFKISIGPGDVDRIESSYESYKYTGFDGKKNTIDIGTVYYTDGSSGYGEIKLSNTSDGGGTNNTTTLNQTDLIQSVETGGVKTSISASIVDIINSANGTGDYVTLDTTQTVTGEKTFELFNISDSGNTGDSVNITPYQMTQYVGGSPIIGGNLFNMIAAGNLQQSQGLVTISGDETITGSKTFNNQVLFESFAPHCDTLATYGNDLTTKAYVDALVGSNTGSGLIFYLDQSLTSDITAYKTLTTTYYYDEPTVYLTTPSLGSNNISGFITDATIPYVYGSPISAGLFSMNIFAYVSVNTGQLNMHFTINKYSTIDSSITLISTSGNTSDINGTNSNAPDLYHMSCSFPETTFLTTDRLLILLYSTGTGMGGGATLTTCYEGSYYSYLNTPISSGGNILTQNNNWTGTNNFTTTTTAPTTATSDSSSNVATTSYVKTNLASYITGSAAASTFQTIAGMSAYLTNTNAASTYQPISGMSSYLTTANASTTYLTKVNPIVSSGSLTMQPNTNILYGNTGTLSIGNTANNATLGTGLRIPKYIDGNDLSAGIFIGYNHIGGFLRSNLAIVANGIGSASQLYSDYISPQTSDTGTLNIGAGLTTGNVNIGNISMSGTTTLYGSSPSLSSTPATGDSTNKIATTAYVKNNLLSYLTSAIASSTYQTISGMSSYLTVANATSTYQTISGMVNYLTTATATTTYQTIAGMSAYLTSTTAASTYQTIAGMTNYLTSAVAASTYQTISGMSSYLTTSSAASTYLSISSASSTYQTIANMTNYLTSAIASSTYQTIAGMSSYLTTSNAASIYQTISGMSSYLTIADASTTYQTIADMVNYLTTTTASTTYQTIAGMGSYLTIAEASSTYAPIDNASFTGSFTTPPYIDSSMTTQGHLFYNVNGTVSISEQASQTYIGNPTGNITLPSVVINLGNTAYTTEVKIASAAFYVDSPAMLGPNIVDQYTSGDVTLYNNINGALYLNNNSVQRTHIGNTTGGTRTYGTLYTSSTLENIVPANNNFIYNTTTGTWNGGSVASTVNLGNGACGSINIGSSTQTGATTISSGTTTTVGSTTQSGNTTIQSNSTTGNIVLKNPLRIENTIAFTSFNQIGYFHGTFTNTGYSYYTNTGGNLKLCSTSNPTPVQLPIGTYMVTAFVNFACTAGATAGVLSQLNTGYTLGTLATYNNTRTTVCGLDNQSDIVRAANTTRTASATSCSWTAYIYNPNPLNYIGVYAIVNISTAFVGGSVGANIISWQLTRLA